MADQISPPAIGNYVRMADGVVGKIIGTTDNLGFPAFEIELDGGKIVTEARYRFDVIANQAQQAGARSNSNKNVNKNQSNVRPNNPPSICNKNVKNNPNHATKRKFQFVDDDDDIDDFIIKTANKNTVRKTESNINVLHAFMAKINEKRAEYEIPPEELNVILCKFFMTIKKDDGSDYEPNSLRGFLSSFDRHFRRHGYVCSIIESPIFDRVRAVLKSKQKLIKQSGKGNLQYRSDALTENDVNKLFESGQLGLDNPESLLRLLWFFNTIHFGLRGVTEHHNMCWGDIKLHIDPEGQEYLEYTERNTKTRTGSNVRDVRPILPRAWANADNKSRCPIAAYKLYSDKRPSTYCHDDHPYYIATNTQLAKSSKWFKSNPVGVNKLGSFMKNMAENAGLKSKSEDGKRLTNHSARKYLIQKLSDEGMSPTQIMQISGHKNVQSVNSYSSLNMVQQRCVSHVLSGTTTRMERPILPAPACRPPTDAPAVTIGIENGPNTTRGSALVVSQTHHARPEIIQPGHSSSAPQDIISNSVINSDSVTGSIFSGPIYGGTFNIYIDKK